MFGYLFASYDPKKYPLFKNDIFLALRKSLDKDSEWKSMSM
jgi:hypothetical protein